MAQTGYTPILIYSSSTASNLPSASNLTNSTLGSELAINIADGKLFYKDTSNAVQVIAWKVTPTSAGGTGLTSYTAGDMLYYASGTALSKLAIGSSGAYMSSSGTAPQWTAPAALTKTDDTNVTLTLGGNASTALLNAASLTLGWTGTLATNRGGTGLSSFTANGVVYASSTSALTTGTALSFDSNTLGVASNVLAAVKANITSSAGNVARFHLESASASYAWYVTDNAKYVALYDYNANAERIRFFASGGVSIGNTTDPGATNLSVTGTAQAAAFIPTGSSVPTNGMYYPASNELAWSTNSTRRLNLFSGGAFSNNTTEDQWYTSTNAGFYADWRSFIAVASSGNVSFVANRLTSDGSTISLRRGGTEVGTISVTATATAYNTSSDYRLKNIEGPLENSGAFIDALQPKVGTWKIDGSRFVGFIAHEVQEISPSTVNGKKDAIDEEGNPIMQAMEYGSAEFIANIVAELQSLRKRVAELEAK